MTPGLVFLTGADIVILAVCVVGCLDYARRWWKGRKEAKERRARERRLVARWEAWVALNGYPYGELVTPVFESTMDAYERGELGGIPMVRPMGAAGYIKESRFTLYAESDAEAIAKLTGEAE